MLCNLRILLKKTNLPQQTTNALNCDITINQMNINCDITHHMSHKVNCDITINQKNSNCDITIKRMSIVTSQNSNCDITINKPD